MEKMRLFLGFRVASHDVRSTRAGEAPMRGGGDGDRSDRGEDESESRLLTASCCCRDVWFAVSESAAAAAVAADDIVR